MKNTKIFIFVLILLIPLNALAGMFGPSNFWECILDEMPGAKNDAVAVAIIRKCAKKFPSTAPGSESTTEIKKKSPLLGPKTCNECIIKYAEDTTSPKGINFIRGACYKLYPKE